MSELREKVARAIARAECVRNTEYVPEVYEETQWEYFLSRADAAILVCREHFAGVAESKIDDDCEGDRECEGENVMCRIIAQAIRSEGEK